MAQEIVRIGVEELKEGKYVVIDNEPCRIVSIAWSKPGKHGAAKIRVEGVGLFDNVKHSFTKPGGSEVEVPILTRRRAQVLSVVGDTASLMDLETFETFEVALPAELRERATPGSELHYIQVMGRRLLTRVEKE